MAAARATPSILYILRSDVARPDSERSPVRSKLGILIRSRYANATERWAVLTYLYQYTSRIRMIEAQQQQLHTSTHTFTMIYTTVGIVIIRQIR